MATSPNASTYIRFSENNDTANSIDRVFASAWSNSTNDLGTSHFSSSTQYVTNTPTSSGAFYMDIYHQNPHTNPTTAEVQYSIAYGSLTGKGGMNFNDDAGAENITSTKAIYSQYRSIVFGGNETQNFSFNGHTPDGIYIINVNRARYKNALRMGNLALVLTGSAQHISAASSSQFDKIHLTDDSVTTSGSVNAIRAGAGREFNLVSGSNGIRLGDSNTFVDASGSYGFVYPDAGLIILNADALDATGSSGGINLNTGVGADTAETNPKLLQNAIIGGGSFILDSQEDIASKFYFCRVFNKEFNYTTNDSFTKTDGTLSFDSMIDNPQTYITTIGLYNDNQDLLAVAKLSQPLPKDFTKEALIKVKLDY